MRTTLTSAAVLCVAAALYVTGCNKSAGEEIKTDQFVGVWVELPPAPDEGPVNPRIRKPPRLSPDMRRIEFTADGNFKLQLCKPDGTPTSAKTMEGAYRIENQVVIFEMKKNDLGQALETWVPEAFNGFKNEGGAKTMYIMHNNGDNAHYKKQ